MSRVPGGARGARQVGGRAVVLGAVALLATAGAGPPVRAAVAAPWQGDPAADATAPGATRPDATTPDGTDAAPTFAVRVDPGPHELGRPLTLTVEAAAPLDLAAAPDPLAAERAARADLRRRVEGLELDSEALEPAWVLVDAGPATILRIPGDEAAPRLVATRTWRLVLLEPGAATVPLPRAPEGAERSEVAPVAPVVTVAGLLGEAEDAPRPGPGFLPLPDLAPEPADGGSRVLPLALGGAAVLAAGALVLRRRRTAPVGPVGPTPAARLAALEPLAAAGSGADPEALRDAHFELTAALRAGLGDDRPGRTDEEFAAALPAARAAAGELLAACHDVKYAGAPASPWALAERLEVARAELAAGGGDR